MAEEERPDGELVWCPKCGKPHRCGSEEEHHDQQEHDDQPTPVLALGEVELYHNVRPPEAELEGLTERGGTTLVIAPSGGHKTRLLVSMLGATVIGGSCLGHQASRQGPALAVVGEDLPGFRERWFAWRADQWHPFPEPADMALPLFTWDRPLNLFSGEGFPGLLEEVERIKPVVAAFDTLADCTEGANDSSSQDMGVVRQRLKLLASGGRSIIVTHHTGLDQSRGRGSTALEAMANTVLLLAADDAGLTLKCRKQRNGPKFPDLPLMFDAATLVLRRADAPGLSVTYRGVLDVLKQLTTNTPAGVRLKAWQEAAVKANVTKARNFMNAKKRLLEGGYVVQQRNLFRPA